MATYLLLATACPALVTPASLMRPGTDTAPSAKSLVNGDTTALFTKFNENATRLDVTGRRAGGAYAVTEGLDLTAAALVGTVTAGQAMLDGPATSAGGTVALADNAYNWLWILPDGTLTKTSSGSATPVPAAPAPACAFLGRIQVTSGTPGTADYSGRWELRGPQLYRKTADVGPPGDTPPAHTVFLSESQDGLYWWTGAAYRKAEAQFMTDRYLTGE